MPTFTRAERLKSSKTISALFAGGGQSFMAYPLRVVWMLMPPAAEVDSPAKVAVSVSKRLFKTAVARNRIKRLIREAHRLNKAKLYEKIPSGQAVALMLIYVGKEELPFAEVEKGVRKMIEKFAVQ
jgi:ribonuclease P protein component